MNKPVPLKTIIQAWNEYKSIDKCVEICNLSWHKIAKTLSTARIIINDTHKIILRYYAEGKTINEISELSGISIKTVQAYLPRTRPEYGVNL